MNPKILILTIINPKKLFGLVKSIDSKGMDYVIEISNDNTIKLIASKNDGSIQLIHTLELSDIFAPIPDNIQFTKLIFKFNFEEKITKLSDYIIRNVRICNLTLQVFEEQPYASVVKLEADSGLYDRDFVDEPNPQENIKPILDKLELLPTKKEKAFLETTIPVYIIIKNLNNPENELWLYLLNKEFGQTLVFSDGQYNLQILGDFTAKKQEFSIQLNSQHLKYLDNDKYHVQVFSKYIAFTSKVRDSVFYIKIEEFIEEASHE